VYYEDAIELNDKEPAYYFNLGHALYRIGEFDKAIQEFDSCISLNDISTETDALYNKALLKNVVDFPVRLPRKNGITFIIFGAVLTVWVANGESRKNYL
jgi:tetratricopeptide (TPR) repeat protein